MRRFIRVKSQKCRKRGLGPLFRPLRAILDPSRAGATLSEILISLLVMSIGVVSLATLFPISVLRSIQATQLTNATILRLNAQELIELYPRLVHDPDVDGNLREHDTEKFVVDPLGATSTILNQAGLQFTFGNNGGAPFPPRFLIRRYHGGFDNMGSTQPPPRQPAPPFARNPYAAYLPDSWQIAGKGNAPALNAAGHTITVAPNVDTQTALNTLNSLGVGSVRLVLFAPNGKSSVTRLVTSITGQVVSWEDPATTTDDLPASFTTVLRYRLEFADPRYSWLLTVRKRPNALNPAADAEVDVVVFHKRAFSAASEQVFNLLPLPGANPNNIGLAARGTQFTLDLTATNALSPPVKPFLKKGGFVFDAQNAHWYRVVQVREDAVNPVVTIDRPAMAPIYAGASGGPGIMAMPGVVEVFPLATISYDQNNPP
jgi:hypothetical protein